MCWIGIFRKFVLLAPLTTALLLSGMSAKVEADEQLLEPPYLNLGLTVVLVGVQWDEEAVRAALPAGLEPAEGVTGGINIYQAEKGYGLAYPYQTVYFWVDLEGFDSEDGTKGRWMLAGAYGPSERISAQLIRNYGWPVRAGTNRVEKTDGGKRSIATVDGNDVAATEIKYAGDCGPAAGTLNYPGQTNEGEIIDVLIPWSGTFCPAEPVSVEVLAPAGDLFAQFKPTKLLWAAEGRNMSASFSRPASH